MDAEHIARWRMHNQRLSGRPFTSAEETVHWLGAVQSQDFGPAKWSIGVRTDDITDADLDRAYADGTILRTHLLRPTWHFVLPEDIEWILKLTAPRIHVHNGHRYRRLRLTEDVRMRSRRLIKRAVEGGDHLTRAELEDVLRHGGIDTTGQRLPYLLMDAEVAGIVCSGRPDGKKHTYALLDDRAPSARTLSRDDALANLVSRFFTSHGPATEKDLQSWSSLTLAEIRRGIAMVESELERDVIGERSYWYVGRRPDHELTTPIAHFLQGYDEYFMGYSQSRDVVDASGIAQASAEEVSFKGEVILDGQRTGHWRRAVRNETVTFDVVVYRPLEREQRAAVKAAADRFGAFLGRDAIVELTTL
ncbi:winged helix DNA-binding domain-containing protein [Haladaptatus halobius]|uniref:winged helix DNA-binding domain-containing protein n=1 Tax=Haladaptatus halobius TaxID=2884875 RepID=UPI001D0A8CCB|nr:winged helix DNA-binding domain-containing protein [Haladaptatus halobius]